MSDKYDDYLEKHIGAVQKAAKWMMEHNIGGVNDLPNGGMVAFFLQSSGA